MKAVFFASAVALIAGVAAQDFQINTPASLTECQPTLIQWNGGTGPYFLFSSVYPDGSPATTLENLGQQSGTSFTWLVNVPAGQSVGFAVTDSTGTIKQSAAVPIQSGGSTSCVGQSGSASGGSAAPTSSGAASSGSSSGSSTTAASGSSSTSGSGSSGSSSSKSGSSSTSAAAGSSTSSASNNGAIAQGAQYGAAGVIGAALVAMLA